MRSCTIGNCTQRHVARGLCKTHYDRWRRLGTVELRSDYERFMSYVDTSGGPDACHPWTGGTRDGYGVFCAQAKTVAASRWLLGHLRGLPLSADEFVLHRCDNPPCVNPRHLYVGDHAQNMRDAMVRGRHYNASRTHCKQGHPLNEANTYVRGRKRTCRTCNRAAAARYQARSEVAS